MTQEELSAQEAAEKAKEETPQENIDSKSAKKPKKEAAEKAKEDESSSPYKVYDEYKVDILRDGDGKVSFEKGKKLRENVKLESFRAEILNNQSINTRTRFYEQQ